MKSLVPVTRMSFPEEAILFDREGPMKECDICVLLGQVFSIALLKNAIRHNSNYDVINI